MLDKREPLQTPFAEPSPQAAFYFRPAPGLLLAMSQGKSGLFLYTKISLISIDII